MRRNVFSIGAGPRYAWRTANRVRPYAQVVAGVLIRRTTSAPTAEFVLTSVTSHAFMVQTGAGATFVMGDRWGLFGDVAYRRSSLEAGSHGVRVLLGARMAASAPAQAGGTITSPTFEWAAAYQLQHVGAWWVLPDRGAETFPNFPAGLAVDAARYWGRLGLVGEVGWGKGRKPVDTFASDTDTNSVFHAGAGPRFTLATAGQVRPYAQVLSGFSVVNWTAAFMVQPGAGATVVMGDRWGVFGDVAYRRSIASISGRDQSFIRGTNEIRVLFGVRMMRVPNPEP